MKLAFMLRWEGGRLTFIDLAILRGFRAGRGAFRHIFFLVRLRLRPVRNV